MTKTHRNTWIGISALLVVDTIIVALVAVLVVMPYLARNHSQTAFAGTNSSHISLGYRVGTPTPTSSPVVVNGKASSTPASVLGSAITPNAVSGAPKAAYVGLFVSDVPGEAGATATLDALAAMGANVAYNYSFTDGSPDGIRSYLAYAQAKHIKIIVGLDNLYGAGGEAIALQMVRDFGANPAVWGFGIADEKPEGPADSAQWMPIVTTRYQKVKALTTKPVMVIAVGWSTPDNGARAAFLRSFTPATDVLAIDSYPIPYYASGGMTQLLLDGPTNRERWFIPQAFNWASYPDTASGLGYNLAQARYPTAAEMESMARQALAGGASSILFYSYFDIKANPNQVTSLTHVIRSLDTN